MPVIDLAAVPLRSGSNYPSPYREMVAGRSYLRLGQAGGLTQFGVNVAVLAPGALSSCRHAHQREDEFVLILSGKCVLVTERNGEVAETVMRPGDSAAFPAGGGELHHLHNRTGEEARVLVVGASLPDEVVTYAADVDMLLTRENGTLTVRHRDGTPYDTAP